MNILSRVHPGPDRQIQYGAEPSQFGYLWIPDTDENQLVPLVIFVHGGWWRSEYDLGYAGHLCAALKRDGIASWSLGYRRVGASGGGWPTTFQDVALGCSFAATLATSFPLDMGRVITMGHSAGGHLAFWLAGRRNIDPRSELHTEKTPLRLKGAIALAGAVDLRMTIDTADETMFARNRENVYALMGGPPEDLPDRYASGNPGELLPFHIPQVLIQGSDDDQIPAALPAMWVERARQAGDLASLIRIPSADHLDVVDPTSKAWVSVRAAVLEMLS